VRTSFDAAFASEFRPLHRYLRRRVGDAAAEDLAAATFATAYANWDRLDPERPVRPWLYGIAANLLRHHWRSESRELRAYSRTGVDPVASPEDIAIEHAEAAQGLRRLAEALAELRAEDREILLLHSWVSMSDREIAEALELPIGTVKSRLHRVRERLRNRLDASGQMQSKTLTQRPKEQR
jgi:RNA polymerase sigma-70 factor (ECF subfamily)